MTLKPLLKADNLFYSFRESDIVTPVLKDVSISLTPGELTAIVGPSGCGKSTLLYLLGLLDTPDSGDIFLHQKNVLKCNENDRTNLRNHEIGFVFQFHFLIKELSVLDNVALPVRKAGYSTADSYQKAKSVLQKLGLLDKANRFPNKLSGGEQQRVAIARAMVNSPSIILADEPTGNLDSGNSENVFSLLSKLAKEENLSVLLVTHNNDLANSCDRVVKMRDGQIIN
jgi:lipoprotein-releasing system ATP-binding protein